MADINVERKGPSIWPWIIGLVVLALLIWALTQMFGRQDRAVGPATPADTAIIDTPAIPMDPVNPGTPAPGTTPPP